MELHHIGKHCDLETCKRLDFLPFKCSQCSKYFCEDHYKQIEHKCDKPHVLKDIKVPICPICKQPVPINRDENPNLKVNQHIDSGCQSSSTQVKPDLNLCQFDKCKTKIGVVGQECNVCLLRFCLKHRYQDTHNCRGPPPKSHFSNNLFGKFNQSKHKNNRNLPSKATGNKKEKDKCVIC